VDKTEFTERLEELARPFVELGIYDSPQKFFKDVIRKIAAEKIKAYQRTINKYQKKYGSFEKFTKKLEGKAKPEFEDEWMDWESAINMLEAWKKASEELGIDAS